MALRLLTLAKSFQKLSLNPNVTNAILPVQAPYVLSKFTNPSFTNSNPPARTRTTNFFNKKTAKALWDGVTSVSNAGKKRGRGKRVSKRNMKDLNRGQIIGVGKINMQWPGLTAPIIRGKELVEQKALPEDPEREKRLIQLRDSMGNTKRPKLSPLERGWSGTKMPGRSIGAPDPIGEDTFEGFDTKVLELKTVINMKGNLGRKRRIACFVITGNGNGLGGFASGKAIDGKTALRKAKNRAAQKLMEVKVFRNHTIYHDFYSQFGRSKLFVSQKPEGYGLKCHRAIKTVCETVGIKDLHAKVEGSTNVQHIVKAFMLGLLRQKTHQQIVEEKGLHLVELRKENGYFPQVLASPTECRKNEDLKHDEVLDFTQYCLEGRVILQRKKFPPFYTKHDKYQIYLKKQERMRNLEDVRIQIRSEYGELRSFLTDKYPEARFVKYYKPKKVVEEEEE